jgi:AraC-like DNA-binding protein
MTHPGSPAIDLFRHYKPFHCLVHYYVDVSCFLVSTDRDWWALNRRKRVKNLYTLEVKYQSHEARDRFLGKGFQQSEKTLRPAYVERFGFGDFFVPIVREGKLEGWLQAGGFAREEVTRALLEDTWRKLARREPSPEIQEFREFARVLLELPVLEGPLAGAFQESLELFAALLGGADDPEGIERRLWRLIHEVFSKRLPHSFWMDWALQRPTSESVPPWTERMVQWSWTRDEIGLTRVPTTVLAVIPQRRPKDDWTEEMLRIYRFQRQAFRFARSVPQTVGGNLEDYGAVFVTSADPKGSRLAQKEEVRAIARRLQALASEALGEDARVGVGETVAPGETLDRSYRQAVLALHQRPGTGPATVFFDGQAREDRSLDDMGFRRLLDEMDHRFATAAFDGLEVLKERYLTETFNRSFHTPNEIRLHFSYALDRLAETSGKVLGMEAEERVRLRESLGGALDEAVNLHEIMMAFREALSRLERLQSSPSTVSRKLTLEKTKEYIDRHLGEPLRIADLARRSGLSVTTFGREFARLTGVGLETYLQALRLREARRLLRGTNQPVARVARECGFRSVSYFTRMFKAKEGRTPNAFRRKSRGA